MPREPAQTRPTVCRTAMMLADLDTMVGEIGRPVLREVPVRREVSSRIEVVEQPSPIFAEEMNDGF